MIIQTKLVVQTDGRGFIDITDDITKIIKEREIKTGLCHLFIQHTSASMIICENYDPLVKVDLEAFMQRLTPDGDPLYQHVEEGPDDMPSHVRSVLTTSFLSLPITDHQLALGKWQHICVWEHRLRAYKRHVVVTLLGE